MGDQDFTAATISWSASRRIRSAASKELATRPQTNRPPLVPKRAIRPRTILTGIRSRRGSGVKRRASPASTPKIGVAQVKEAVEAEVDHAAQAAANAREGVSDVHRKAVPVHRAPKAVPRREAKGAEKSDRRAAEPKRRQIVHDVNHRRQRLETSRRKLTTSVRGLSRSSLSQSRPVVAESHGTRIREPRDDLLGRNLPNRTTCTSPKKEIPRKRESKPKRVRGELLAAVVVGVVDRAIVARAVNPLRNSP